MINEDDEYDKERELYDIYIKDKKLKPIKLEELVLYDKISIVYTPDSQKYINELYPKFGRIIKLGKEIEDIILENNNRQYSGSHYWVSNCYSNNRGFEYDISIIS